MKKILAILGALTFTASGATTVVACSTKFGRFSKPSLSDKLKNMIIAEVTGKTGGKDNDIYGKKTFGDIFNNSSATEKLAVRLINQIVSEYFYGSTNNQWKQWAGVNGEDSQSTANYTKIFRSWIISLATDQLYQDYLSTFANNNYLEITSIDANYSLYFDPTTGDDHKGLGWAVPGITYYYNGDDKSHPRGTPIPSIDASFYKTRSEIKKALYNSDPKEGDISKLKEQLAYTFHNYLYYVEVPKIIDNVIGQAFLNTNMLKNYQPLKGDNSIYVSKSGPLMSSMMNWNEYNPSPSTIKSNFKMVWEFKIRKDHTGPTINGIQTNINNAEKGSSPTITGGSWSPDNFNKFVNENFDTDSVGTNQDYNENGGDPIFGIAHFKGFAAYDNQGNIVNGFKTDTYGDQLKAAKTAGFLSSGGTGGNITYNFADSAGEYETYAYVLPIYVPDLLGGGTTEGASVVFKETGTTPTYKTKAINLKDYSNPNNIQDITWKGLFSGDATGNGRSVNYLLNYSTVANKKVLATFGDTASDGKTAMFDESGHPNTAVDFTRYKLMQWAQYSYAQSSSVQELAKERLYSIAFDYNKKNLYSSNLYNDIGKYIEDKN